MLAFVIFITNVVVISAVPSYSNNNFLGYSYWNARCSVNYKQDWIGFWNNYYNQQTEYGRKKPYQYIPCPSGCDCSKQELECRGFAGTVL